MTSRIDVSFNFKSDSGGRDPDAYSRTLREYHRVLWSKPLPNGELFTLEDATRGAYLHHRSALGDFFLTSDTLNQAYGKTRLMADSRSQCPDEVDRFRPLMYTIGNMIIFPGRRIKGGMTINQARGCRIGDRWDLTLECIRRHYSRQDSPLADDIMRYAQFFNLFGSFRGYVEYFLLQDLVADDCTAVKFYLPLADFDHRSRYPRSVDTFTTYLHKAMEFIEARNRRIIEHVRGVK
jgi:hypothetical protein